MEFVRHQIPGHVLTEKEIEYGKDLVAWARSIDEKPQTYYNWKQERKKVITVKPFDPGTVLVGATDVSE